MTTTNRPVTGPTRRSFGLTPVWATAFLLVHVPLGRAMEALSTISTIHALVVFAIGIIWALGGHEDRVAVWGGYVAVCDVLWRMTHASVLWEFAKYSLVLVFAIAVFRSKRLRGTALPLIYLGLLVPSSLLVVWVLGPSLGFNAISFNLSGPLALAVAVWFFSRLTLSASSYATVLVAMVGPTLSVSTIVLSGALSTEEFEFQGASNFALSGGYGPNQVASVLALGAVVLLLLLVMTRGAVWQRVIFFFLMVGLAGQSALTFSRGGLLTAAGAVMAAVPFLAQTPGARRRLMVGGAAAVGVTLLFVLPRMESFTEGALGARFENLNTTGRAEMAMADLTMWKENPILGVGVGMGATNLKRLVGYARSAHTEWTRLVAEHGVLGFGAAVCLVLMGWRAVAHGRRPLERGLAAAFVVWAFLFMFHAGMRIAAPSFALGLAQCRIGGATEHPRGRRE